ncbi:MAG TPA: hypothetical protein VL486_02615 [Verrucomicrobiae bacterium]|nr:hypothetical protein [Verrucomicrobiae bacterium]
MSKTLVRCAMAACVAAVALTVGHSARAADEKPAATAMAKSEVLVGKIESVDTTAGTITIKHKKETKTFTVASDCKITGAGNKKATLADLKAGDHIKVTYTEEGDKAVAHLIGHVDVVKKKKAEDTTQPK